MTAHGTGFLEAITGATGLKLIITAATCRPALRRVYSVYQLGQSASRWPVRFLWLAVRGLRTEELARELS